MDDPSQPAASSPSPSDPVRNPYASPKQTDDPPVEPPRRSRPMLEPLSPACRAVFGIDLAFCFIRVAMLAVALMYPAWLAISTADIVFILCDGVVLACAIIGDIMLLNEIPAGRWYGWLSVPATLIVNFVLFLSWAHASDAPSSFVALVRIVFSIIFMAMYITALVECSRRPRSEKPAYLWSDLMK